MNVLNRHFLLIALSASLVALLFPPSFIWVKPLIAPLLALIMFGMGTTISAGDFRDVWRKRNIVLLAAVVQYTVMPGLAVLIGSVLRLPEELMIGMVLVGSCPSGTASNVIVYLSKGNVPLSVTMTMFSTMLAPVLTPTIIYLLLQRSIDVSFSDLFLSVFQLVALPLVAGLLVRHFFAKQTAQLETVLPSISVISITLIIACVMALNAERMLAFPVAVIVAVVLHNLGGLAAGYAVATLARCEVIDRRTIAIEIGMQNSGLGVTLANQFFQPLSALPGALFSLWHNLSGIALARNWNEKATAVKSEA
ncbi:MAG TPA: bile acid:sodium symporter family protein [Chlorobaculum parvum]|uniref:Bile acid:sodium symporter family protein n=1 Tax=Chlorobaculum parvum TaxID=274539 RepID=A0A7C5HT72_9CHLB|nr:bile acid:sodium symporter family protein [Chlorobaculum parvum]